MRLALASVAIAGVLGATLLGPAPAAEAATTRLDGADRFETSVLASQRVPTGDVVFLASGTSFPDALAAAPVVAAEQGHLLLTLPDGIPAVVQREIARIAPSEIVLLGSEATLSAAVAREAGALVSPGGAVERIGGADRIETSMLLLDRLRGQRAVTDVWVASAGSFPDALAAGAVAARHGHGLVLTAGVDASFRQRLEQRIGGVQRFHIPGSTASVGADVESYLAGKGTVRRFPGADRYETAVLINQRFTSSSAGGEIVLASGAGFPDGLVGAAMAGRRGQALYLTAPECATSGSVAAETRRLGTTGVAVLGGTGSVSPMAAELVPCAALDASTADLLDRINRERAAAGVQPLRSDGCLARMAGGWASAMADGSLSGSAHNPALGDEARACALRAWGENVGRTWGTSSPDTARIMSAWMASEGHRNNILRASFTHIGIGIDRSEAGHWYYVLDFGTR
ncbi:cell wall-binding repeat-containing protein [Agrococcus sp. HG114]|uniref:cell wall-binding repeat-containing protein n=1 Tax=Agrococcus sp. HG114 TaxID=2969757 RepID=UPI00215AC6DA|nr:cell wall-binding repeat-containing protein [Agrococcus sp. HG114]MCR8671020.1 cell wall-binding repeat-containing protein [Agrococcus sp. HG114]